ncbi:MAG: type II toxin-antitoxin system prevent-host-death family antitoxin [Nakamurella sp.]
MERIGVRELRQNASKYLDKVKAGETVEVTERGTLVALLVPPSRDQTARDRLIAEGKLLPGSGRPIRFPTPVRATLDSGAVLDEMREDRF